MGAGGWARVGHGCGWWASREGHAGASAVHQDWRAWDTPGGLHHCSLALVKLVPVAIEIVGDRLPQLRGQWTHPAGLPCCPAPQPGLSLWTTSSLTWTRPSGRQLRRWAPHRRSQLRRARSECPAYMLPWCCVAKPLHLFPSSSSALYFLQFRRLASSCASSCLLVCEPVRS